MDNHEAEVGELCRVTYFQRVDCHAVKAKVSEECSVSASTPAMVTVSEECLNSASRRATNIPVTDVHTAIASVSEECPTNNVTKPIRFFLQNC